MTVNWKEILADSTRYKKTDMAVLAPSGIPGAYDEKGVDCPFVFSHGDHFYMLHVGFDGTGYQTALAESRDLVNWKKTHLLFPREQLQGWDSRGIAGCWIIKEDSLEGLPRLKKIDSKYWMVYHAYPQTGYEAGPAEIGLAWTEDETLKVWHRKESPVLSWKNGAPWERGGLYKASIVEADGKFYLFYNAKNRDIWPWIEQIGVAVSDNLINWERPVNYPLVKITEGGWDSRFAADPFVVSCRDQWVMFYYGFDGIHAQEGIAFSKNLMDWKKHPEPILKKGKTGDIDETHAHKPSVIIHDNRLFHYYCAVRPSKEEDQARNEDPTGVAGSEYRCISLAVCSFGKDQPIRYN